ncbi:MAG: DNA polymerase III subunit [Dehalococcoidales bacterium]|jgi:DNA polymerase-3 subunit delta'|nr:DNA polymerase III subunit [Dehalococcoidales bacterium]
MWRVVGQDSVISLLKRSLEKNSLAHAYLITGPRHIGKMTLAMDLAQAINCSEENPPCGECKTCVKIKEGKHADIQVITLTQEGDESESISRVEIGIDRIRQIQHMVCLLPFEGKRKVFIIKGAELLSIEAANCLLKTLEEPITQSVFILLTINISLLPETVISRCQKLSLNTVPVAEIENYLVTHYGIESVKAKVLGRLSRGCLGWAISATQDEKILESFGEKRKKILEMMESNLDERFSYAAVLATQFGKERAIAFDILDIWLDLWRDILLLKIGLGEEIVNIDIKNQLIELANNNDLLIIRGSIKSIMDAKEQLNQNANPRLTLEVLMLDVPVRTRDIAKR